MVESRRLNFVPLWTLLLAVLLALSGCAGTPTSNEDAFELRTIWPEPPNPPRYIFDGVLRSLADIRVETEDERMRRMLTGRGSVSDETVFVKPSAIAASKGLIYVADPPNASIVVFDIPRARIYRIGLRRPNHVARPVAMATDSKDKLYVLDAAYRKVMVYDALGLFLYSVGDPKELNRPSGVAASPDGETIYVVDRGSLEGDDHKVIAYAPDGSERFRIGPRGTETGRFNIPIAASVTPDGTLFVLDAGNFRVQAFDKDGRFLRAFGNAGNGFGQFSRPRSLTTDLDGNIFVSDGNFNNVQIFNPEGELLMWIGTPDLRNAPGHFGLVAGLTTDETGRLYVIDHYHKKIEVYRRATAADGAAKSPP